MTRRNFPPAIIKRRLAHCGSICEWVDEETKIRCTTPLAPGRFQADHDNPDGLTGQPTFENCRCLCLYHHKLKTARDVKAIAKAKRRESAHLGVKTPGKQPIASRGFPRTDRPTREAKAMLPPRLLFK